MATLTGDVQDQGGVRRVTLRGSIDEHVDFERLAKAIAAPVVALDFDKVESINSVGIRSWINFIKQLSSSKITYERCPAFFLDSISMVPGLAKGVTIASFYLPFSCRSCDSDQPKLVTREQAKAPGFTESLNTLFPCQTCDRKVEFQDDLEVFFNFLG
jgi:hypothetical protein